MLHKTFAEKLLVFTVQSPAAQQKQHIQLRISGPAFYVRTRAAVRNHRALYSLPDWAPKPHLHHTHPPGVQRNSDMDFTPLRLLKMKKKSHFLSPSVKLMGPREL